MNEDRQVLTGSPTYPCPDITPLFGLFSSLAPCEMMMTWPVSDIDPHFTSYETDRPV